MAQSPKTAHAGGNLRTPAQSLASSHTAAQSAQNCADCPPPHYLRRVARSILLRAAVRGRISWIVALQVLALVDGGAQ
ncbi:hypothetical protein [uncultured Azohydromonas sp.]|uniref:hypothetical protein n=1 Tax=uncultured Azohydromonas sp. TaxID=487342 RepID=UPI002626B673|nr:hypothetical protein [uncultured Azohydromonas sp.]